MTLILAATAWPTNGALLADVHRLGYLRADDVVLDPTYGRGRWWTDWRPAQLIAHDLVLDGVDFRRLPEETGTVDVVAFDPPYIAQGGRATSTLAGGHDEFGRRRADFLDRYGLYDVPKDVAGVIELMAAGIAEFYRVLRPGGLLLVKCMNYVTSGRYRRSAYDVLAHAELLGFTLVDELVHLRRPGPQPQRDYQHHARRNYSLLFVLRRDARPWQQQLFDEASEVAP